MAVAGNLVVIHTEKVQALDDPFRRQVVVAPDVILDKPFLLIFRTEGLHLDGDGLCHADGMRCASKGKKAYQYRQFCELYSRWCEENYETAHFTAVIAQTMEVDFAGKTFDLIDRLTGEVTPIVVFVAVLPYSQYIYSEGMSLTKEMQWIEVINNALKTFGGVPAIVVCDKLQAGCDRE